MLVLPTAGAGLWAVAVPALSRVPLLGRRREGQQGSPRAGEQLCASVWSLPRGRQQPKPLCLLPSTSRSYESLPPVTPGTAGEVVISPTDRLSQGTPHKSHGPSKC